MNIMKFFIIKKRFFFYFFISSLILILFFFGLSLYTAKEVNSTLDTDGIANIYQTNAKIAYLTFDDGPSKEVTPKILDILEEYNVKANFFVIGKKVEENPELVKREYEEGHFIANHTYSHHSNKLYISKKSFLEEIHKTDEAISKAIEKHYVCHLFRFPNGLCPR